MIQRVIIIVLMALLYAGCGGYAVQLPTARELDAVGRHRQVLVLFRVTTTRDGQGVDLLTSHGPGPRIGFESAGMSEAKDVEMERGVRGLDEASWRDGWCYVMLAPGSYYLGIAPLKQIEEIQKPDGKRPTVEARRAFTRGLHLEVPADAAVVYAGRMEVAGTVSGSIFAEITAFGAPVFSREEATAAELVRRTLPALPAPRTVMMMAYGSHGPLPAVALAQDPATAARFVQPEIKIDTTTGTNIGATIGAGLVAGPAFVVAVVGGPPGMGLAGLMIMGGGAAGGGVGSLADEGARKEAALVAQTLKEIGERVDAINAAGGLSALTAARFSGDRTGGTGGAVLTVTMGEITLVPTKDDKFTMAMQFRARVVEPGTGAGLYDAWFRCSTRGPDARRPHEIFVEVPFPESTIAELAGENGKAILSADVSQGLNAFVARLAADLSAADAGR